MESINLREAGAGDVLPILELWRVTKSGPSVTDTPEHLQMLIDKMPDLFVVAESETRLAGSIIGGWDYWRAHIYRLAVHPDFRRLGLARRLTTEIEQRLRARGAVRIYALAATKQEISVKFWESLPYEKSKDIPYVRTFAE